VFLLSGVIVQFLEVGQIFGQVPNSVMSALKTLYLGAQGLVPFLLDSKVNHWGECLPGKEGVSLLACENSTGVWVFPCPEWAQVARTVASLRQEKFGVVGEEVIPIEGGLYHSSSQPQDGI
jgi:hypothetical protein